MIELIDYGGFVVALVVGYVGGRTRKPKPPKIRPPICTCKHGYGQHENGAKCQAEVVRPNQWNKEGYERGWEYVPCSCLNYDGPMTFGG